MDNGILIHKLGQLGFPDSPLKWLASYLSGREQIVKVKRHCSDPIVVPSGVPRGSHLGPFLFILFINDISHGIKTANIIIFFDDIKIFTIVRSPMDQSKLQRDLDVYMIGLQFIKIWTNVKRYLSVGVQRLYLDTNMD